MIETNKGEGPVTHKKSQDAEEEYRGHVPNLGTGWRLFALLRLPAKLAVFLLTVQAISAIAARELLIGF